MEGDVAFARVAVVDATFVILLLVRLAARLAFLFLAATSPSPVPSVPPIDFILRRLRAPLLHVGLRRRASARPAEARDAACGERVGRAAGAQVGELAPARVGAGSRVGRAVGGAALLPGGKNWPELRAGGARALLADAAERGRGDETEAEKERVLLLVASAAVALACAGEFWSARPRDERGQQLPPDVVLLRLPVLLQQIRPRLPRAAALQDCSCCRRAVADCRGRDPALGAAVLPLCREKSHGRHFGLWGGQREQLRRRWRKGAKSTHFSPRSHQCSVTCERLASTGFCLRSEGSEKAK